MVVCPRCGKEVEPYKGRRASRCPECLVPLRLKHVWPEGSEEAQQTYKELGRVKAEYQRRREEIQADADRKIKQILKLENDIKARMMQVWQDNDAPEAEEITMTSLAA